MLLLQVGDARDALRVEANDARRWSCYDPGGAAGTTGKNVFHVVASISPRQLREELVVGVVVEAGASLWLGSRIHEPGPRRRERLGGARQGLGWSPSALGPFRGHAIPPRHLAGD